MPLKEVKGNLLDVFDANKIDVIIHQCNCYKTMGAGIAAQIKQRYPAAYEADLKTFDPPEKKLGKFSSALVRKLPNGYVVNMYSQLAFGGYKHNTSYDAMFNALKDIKKIFKNSRIGIPKYIGCGLAGGEWEIVEAIFKNIFKDKEILVVEYVK